MSPDDFNRALKQGLGRAVLYLEQHDDVPHRDLIVRRSAFVEHLDALDQLPQWIIDECQYDSYDGIRDFVRDEPDRIDRATHPND